MKKCMHYPRSSKGAEECLSVICYGEVKVALTSSLTSLLVKQKAPPSKLQKAQTLKLKIRS
jgi:hypothetical protein